MIFSVIDTEFSLAQLQGMLDELTDNSNRVTASLQRLEAPPHVVTEAPQRLVELPAPAQLADDADQPAGADCPA